MTRKNVTLSLNGDIYEEYRKFCDKNAIALSRSVEVFMEKKVNNEDSN